MLAYPPEYRRARAGELLDTLLAATPAGRTRPPLRQAVSLLRHGMRARLGRPASRGVVVIALFGALIAGFVGAQVGAFAAWHTARPLPDPAAAAAIYRLVAPDSPAPQWNRRDELFYVTMGTDHDPAMAEVGGLMAFHTSVASQPLSPAEFAEQARSRMRAAGWDVSEVFSRYDTTFYAARDGLLVRVAAADAQMPQLLVEIYRDEPVLVPIAQLIGALSGALLGWLLIGWASRRLADGRRTAVSVLGVAAIAVAFAASFTVMALVALVEVGRGFRPTWDPMPSFLVFAYPLARELAIPAALAALGAVLPAALTRARCRDAT